MDALQERVATLNALAQQRPRPDRLGEVRDALEDKFTANLRQQSYVSAVLERQFASHTNSGVRLAPRLAKIYQARFLFAGTGKNSLALRARQVAFSSTTRAASDWSNRPWVRRIRMADWRRRTAGTGLQEPYGNCLGCDDGRSLLPIWARRGLT